MKKDKSIIKNYITIITVGISILALVLLNWTSLHFLDSKLEACDLCILLLLLTFFVVCSTTITYLSGEPGRSVKLIEACESNGLVNAKHFVVLRTDWNKSQYLSAIAHYLCASGSLISTAAAIYISQANGASAFGEKGQIFYGLVSIILTVFEVVGQPYSLSKGYRKAYEIMNYSLYSVAFGKMSINEFLESVKKAEHMIGRGYLY